MKSTIYVFLVTLLTLIPLTVFAAYKIPARNYEISPKLAPVKVESYPTSTSSESLVLANPVATSSILQGSRAVEYVENQAKAQGVNPIDALWILDHESQDCQNLSGDDGQSEGCWMISKIYHPEVSQACALDLVCSTQWSLNWIKKGNINQWTTWKYRFLWFPNQNPPL